MSDINIQQTTIEEIFHKNSSSEAEEEEGSFRISLRSKHPSDEIQFDLCSRIGGEKSVADDDICDSYKCGIILCVMWKAGKLGAAYYNPADLELYIVPDTLDLAPEFSLMKNLYTQITPTLTITVGSRTSQFVNALGCVSENGPDDNEYTETSDSLKSLPPNIHLLKTKEYSYDICENAIKNLRLPNEPPEASQSDRFIFLSGLINFDGRTSVHALGALLIFMDKYKGTVLGEQEILKEYLYININTISVKDFVLIDRDTFQALQIFNPIGHPAAYKRGIIADNKEGLSLYKLFNRCVSSLGRITLRSLLMHPTNNIITLTKRLEFVEFFVRPVNASLMKSTEECLKNIFSLTGSLNKIHGRIATVSNWKILYTTLHNILVMQLMFKSHLKSVELFHEFDTSITDSVQLIVKTIENTIDFEANTTSVSIKYGIDEELDKKKQFRAELREKISLAAQHEIKNFPLYIKDCAIIYIPRIGYLVAVEKWDDYADYKDLEQYGFRYMFEANNSFYFKSPVCDGKLDDRLGDIHTDIKYHESRLVLRLSEHVMERSNRLKAPLKFVGLFDSLICMAKVAKEFGYIRPQIVHENVINIIDGVHPLLDISTPIFVPNNFLSGGENSVVKILTGPNNSGKSVYLKQNALILYMAHIGSYVPAKSAKIGLMSGIHTCLHTIESASIRMSAFALELRQIFQASKTCKRNSLVLIDEFGIATTEYDGLALLTAYLEQFLLSEEHCPHILVSTHHLKLTQLIPECAKVEHFKCQHKVDEEKIVFLHKIVKGVSRSFALEAAAFAGLPDELIKRCRELMEKDKINPLSQK